MAHVKGSPIYRLKVVPHRPVRTALITIALTIAIATALIATYRYAFYQATRSSLAPDQALELEAKIQQADESAAELKRELARMQVNAEVDRQAGEELRKQVVSLREEKAALTREVDVYRIMTSEKNKNPRGISFGLFSVTALPDDKYKVKLVVQKLAEGGDDFVGSLRFFVVGSRNGEQTKISLHELAVSTLGAEPLTEELPLNFKFFQNIEMDIVLPDGFTPATAELTVQSSSRPNPVIITGQLEWPEVK